MFDFNLTGETVSNDYKTFTKAICDKDNFCQDYEIVCRNNEVISAEPITGASIKLPDNWEDTRINKSEIKCE